MSKLQLLRKKKVLAENRLEHANSIKQELTSANQELEYSNQLIAKSKKQLIDIQAQKDEAISFIVYVTQEKKKLDNDYKSNLLLKEELREMKAEILSLSNQRADELSKIELEHATKLSRIKTDIQNKESELDSIIKEISNQYRILEKEKISNEQEIKELDYIIHKKKDEISELIELLTSMDKVDLFLQNESETVINRIREDSLKANSISDNINKQRAELNQKEKDIKIKTARLIALHKIMFPNKELKI